MKQLTLSITLFLFAVILTAQKASVPDFNTLKKGDWFELEFTDNLNSDNFLFISKSGRNEIPEAHFVNYNNFEFNPYDESLGGQLWNPDSLLKFTFKSQVIKIENGYIDLAVLVSRIQYSMRINLSHQKTNGYRYYDSYYPFITGKEDNKKDTYISGSDTVVYTINVKTGNILKNEYHFTNDTVRFQRYFVKDGIMTKQLYKTLKIEYTVSTKELFKKTVNVYLKIWKQLYSDNEVRKQQKNIWLFKNTPYLLEQTNRYKNIYVDKTNKSWFSVAKGSSMPMVFYVHKYHFLTPKYLQGNVIRVTDASFSLAPNVKIYCTLKKVNNLKDTVRFIMEDQTEKNLDVINDSMIVYRFFLKEPKYATLNINGKEIRMALTPGDSLVFNINRDAFPKEVQISGKGSAICNYIYERDSTKILKPIYSILTFLNKEQDNLKLYNKIDSVREIYLNLFDKYKDNLSGYWKKGEQINIDYWYINLFMSVNEVRFFYWKQFKKNYKEINIPWKKPFIEKLSPSVDYLYHSLEHKSFVFLYNEYRQKQLLSLNTALTSINFKEQYMLTKIIYSGYPMYIALVYNFVKLLAYYSNDIEKVNDYYNEFMNYCEDPVFIKSINEIYEGIDSIQPGKNIKDIDLFFIDKLKLQSVASGYILLSVADTKYTNTILDWRLSPVLKKYGFNNIPIVVVKPYSQKYQDKLKNFKGNVSFYYSSRDSFLHDNKKILSEKNNMILIRNDGVIIKNRISDFEEVFSNLPQTPPSPDLSGFYRIIIIVLISVFLAVIVTIVLIRYRNQHILKKEEAKRRLAELELKAIRSQMNPHFMFNSLNSIQNIINKNKIKEANLYLSRFANMMRMVLNNSDKPLVPLDEEIQLIKTYLELEQLRIHFHYNINVSGELVTEEEEIPGMLVQPFVENAVIHGMAPNRGGNIIVDISKNDDILRIEIIDDGIGINERSLQKGNGKAMKMVEERIKILNSQNKIPLIVDVTDMKEAGNGTGTKVVIIIPV